jgi:hypothetical protein
MLVEHLGPRVEELGSRSKAVALVSGSSLCGAREFHSLAWPDVIVWVHVHGEVTLLRG